MKENKLIKILIPIVAIVVVFESIMLVSNLDKGSQVSDLTTDVKTEKKVVVEEPVADFVWQADVTDMKVGKSYDVSLNMLSKKDLTLDSIEAYMYFDPKVVTLSKLTTNKEIGEELKTTGIDNKTGLVSVLLWSSDEKGKGYETQKGETVEVLSFTVTPIAEGKVDFDLSTSTEDKKFASIIVETNTNKSLVYSSNKLEINVTK